MINEKKLKILMVEQSAEDAERVRRLLVQGGLQPDCLRVATIAALRDALLSHDWDVILSDYDLPQLGAQDVLQALANRGLDIPLIIVSSHVG
ncbi:MAG: response regulator, partial [Pseudomonadota bacterium]